MQCAALSLKETVNPSSALKSLKTCPKHLHSFRVGKSGFRAPRLPASRLQGFSVSCVPFVDVLHVHMIVADSEPSVCGLGNGRASDSCRSEGFGARLQALSSQKKLFLHCMNSLHGILFGALAVCADGASLYPLPTQHPKRARVSNRPCNRPTAYDTEKSKMVVAHRPRCKPRLLLACMAMYMHA